MYWIIKKHTIFLQMQIKNLPMSLFDIENDAITNKKLHLLRFIAFMILQ